METSVFFPSCRNRLVRIGSALVLAAVLPLVGFAQVPSYVPTSGLVAFWPLNGTGTNAASPFNQAMAVGTLPTVDRHGQPTAALELTSGSYLVVPNNPTLHFPTKQITLSAWVFLPDTLANARIFSKDLNNAVDRDFMGKLQDNVWYAGTYSEDGNFIILNAPTPLGIQQWHHLVYTKDTQTATVYIDGVPVGSHAASNEIHYSPSDLYLGKAFAPGGEYFSGKLDDVGMWSRSLSAAEVAALYAGCSGSISVQPQSLVAYTQPGWAQFTCVSTDPQASYQWEVNTGNGWTPVFDFGPYTGSTTSQLVLGNVHPGMHRNGYRCRVTGCDTQLSSTAVLTVVSGLDTQETQFQSAWLSPNPTSGPLVFNAALEGSYRWMDAWGRTVETGTLQRSTAATRLDLSTYAPGMYLLEVTASSGQQRIFRVVRQ